MNVDHCIVGVCCYIAAACYLFTRCAYALWMKTWVRGR